MRTNNSSPVTHTNSWVQLQTMGNFLSGTHSDSDKDSYETPPETESEPEYDEDPNAPELSDDDLENDEEVEELLNRPENDLTISLHSFLNFPDILNLNTADQGTCHSDTEHSDNYPPSHSLQRKSKSPIPTGGEGSSWTYTPSITSEVRLPQLYQPPGAEGSCIPQSNSPPR